MIFRKVSTFFDDPVFVFSVHCAKYTILFKPNIFDCNCCLFEIKVSKSQARANININEPTWYKGSNWVVVNLYFMQFLFNITKTKILLLTILSTKNINLYYYQVCLPHYIIQSLTDTTINIKIMVLILLFFFCLFDRTIQFNTIQFSHIK